MKINEKDQRYLLAALRWQLEDIRREINSTQQMLNERSFTPEILAALELDLKDELEIEREHKDLISRIKAEVI